MNFKIIVSIFSMIAFLIISAYSSEINISNYHLHQRTLVAGDKVNVREKPSLKSKILTQLDTGKEVFVEIINPKVLTIGSQKGNWAYVDCFKTYDNGKKIKGWVFDYYLAYKYRFKKMTKWNYKKKLSQIVYVDDSWEYVFKKTGSFRLGKKVYIGSDENKKKGCKEWGAYKYGNSTCYFKGHMYKYLNLFWAKIPSHELGGNEYLTISRNRICVVFAEDIVCE